MCKNETTLLMLVTARINDVVSFVAKVKNLVSILLHKMLERKFSIFSPDFLFYFSFSFLANISPTNSK